jgi:hypothetical protein
MKSSNNKIENNIITTFDYSSWAISFDYSSSHNIINNNRITTFGDVSDGINYFDGSSNNIHNNNVITTYGNESNGIHLWGCCSWNLSVGPVINNQFMGGVINTYGTDSYGILMEHSYNNTFIDSSINASNAYSIYQKNQPFLDTNYFINTTFDKNNVDIQSGNMFVQWYLNVFTNSSIGPLNNVNVKGYTNDGTQAFSSMTNSNGYIERQTLTEYMQNVTDKYFRTDYIINVTKIGYDSNLAEVNLTSNLLINMNLNLSDTTPTLCPADMADLTVTDIIVEPKNLVSGGSMNLNAVIKNQGSVATAFSMEFKRISPNGGVSGGGNLADPTDLIEPSENKTISFGGFGPNEEGNYTIIVTVHSESPDCELSNNNLTETFYVSKVNVSEERPIINITNPFNSSTINADSVWLNVTTNKDFICKYDICKFRYSEGTPITGGVGGGGCSKSNNMSVTDGTSHLQFINGLENTINNETYGEKYRLDVRCIDDSGNSNRASVWFYVDIPPLVSKISVSPFAAISSLNPGEEFSTQFYVTDSGTANLTGLSVNFSVLPDFNLTANPVLFDLNVGEEKRVSIHGRVPYNVNASLSSTVTVTISNADISSSSNFGISINVPNSPSPPPNDNGGGSDDRGSSNHHSGGYAPFIGRSPAASTRLVTPSAPTTPTAPTAAPEVVGGNAATGTGTEGITGAVVGAEQGNTNISKAIGVLLWIVAFVILAVMIINRPKKPF